MVIKRLRIPLMLLIAALVLSAILPMIAAAAVTDPPAGFTGMASVDLEVDSGYAWHTMSAEEAAAYALDAYADSTVYVAGNSGRTMPTSGTVSNIAITVTDPGELTFEYALSAYVASVSSDMKNDYLGWSIGSEITKDDSVDTIQCIVQGEKRPSGDTWATYSISIDESAFTEQNAVTIYIAFENMGWYEGDFHLNYAAIRNVVYTTGGRADVVKDYDTSMGTVTAQLVGNTLTDTNLSDMAIGSTYRLTATANSGYQFYGWMKHSADGTQEYQTLTSGKLDVTVDQSAYYTPVFAATGTYVLRNGITFYDSTTSLKTAVESAQSGDVLVLLKDTVVSESITVPVGVTLYVPFRAEWEKEEAGYYDSYGNYLLKHHLSKKGTGHTAIAGEDETYVRLTVNSGSTLTVNGDVVIGSVISYASQRFQGHVSGAHGRITNNGTITVNDGGTLKCYGIVDGSGKVYVEDGGTVKESFIIGDFAGGSNTAELFFTSQMPFKRFSMQSVQCKLQMETKATMVAMMSVWASSAYNEAEVILVGDDAEAAFRPNAALTDTVALTRTYNSGKALSDGNGLLDVSGIGRTEWTFSSGLTFQPLTVSVGGITVDTSSSDFTIPYNFKINLVEGTYQIPLGMRLLPGAEITIESGATVYVGGRLMVLDGLVQTDMSGDRYPKRSELTANGLFSGSGELVVNGTLIMQKGSTLGGLVKSNGGGTLVVEDGVYLNNSGTLAELNYKNELSGQLYDLYTSEGGVVVRDASGGILRIENWVQQDGAVGAYDENTTWFNLPARILTVDGVQQVQAGKTYVTEAQSGTAEYTIEYLYVEDGVFGSLGNSKYGYLTASGSREMTAATENLSRSVGAVWVDSEASKETVEVAEPVVAGSGTEGTLTYNVTVSYTTGKSGASTVLSELTAIDATTKDAKDEKYVFLVKYTVEGNSTGITVTPVSGVYTIPSEAKNVTIEATVLGDVTGDGKILTGDYAKIKNYFLKKVTEEQLGELGKLAGDVTGDGKILTGDYAKLKNYFLKKITSL